MSTTFNTYRRLVGFTRPYRFRLFIGIIAGFFVGGSLFGMLHFSPRLLQPFDSPGAAVTTISASEAPPTAAQDEVATSPQDTIQAWADRFGIDLTDANGRMTWQFMLLTILVVPLLATLKLGAAYINRYCMHWVGSHVVKDLRNALFENLQRQSLAFFGRVDIGSLISRCTNDTVMVESAISQTIADLTRAPIEIIAAVAFVIVFSLQHQMLGALLVIIVIFPLCILPLTLLGRVVKRHSYRALQRISDLVSRMQENFTGIRVVKAFDMEDAEVQRFNAMNHNYFRTTMKALRAELMTAPLMESVSFSAACAFLVFCYARGIQLSQIIPVGGAAVIAYRPFKQLAKINTAIQRSCAAAERIFEQLDTNTTLPENPQAQTVHAFTDAIAFDNVSFAYSSDGPQILSNLNFRIRRGSIAAFVGETGAGKTTIANLLARFYDPTGGAIRLDGHDLRDLETHSLRRLIGIVTQEVVLFNDTIANNIAYGIPEATRAQIIDAARKANAHDFIVADPEGYDKIVGDKGCRLSGGQRQRVAIARAVLKNPPILILDEATSALDTATEKLVQEALTRLMQDRTVFAIAHRLSTIRNADQIFVLDNGRVIESGTHAQLFADQGHYHKLCTMQFN